VRNIARFAFSIVLLSTVGPTQAHARGRPGASPDCKTVTQTNVVTCALEVSAAVRAEREAAVAAAGRRTASTPWFPSSPTLTFSAARRASTEGRGPATNLYATLSQEVEIAGQRASRRRAAEAEIAARNEDVVATRRHVAANAYATFFDTLAAREALAVATRLETTGSQIARVTRARADAGVASALDAEVTDASSLRLAQHKLAADRELRTAKANLAMLLGRDPLRDPPDVEGNLEPLSGSDALADAANPNGVRDRPEVRALAQERRSFEATAESYRRARFPNFTLQVYGQNDGYDERVFGAGLSFPIPLPEPLGRLYTGQIAEASALARRSGERVEVATRELTGELASAVAEYQTRRAEAALYAKDRVARAEQVMSDIGKEIEGGRLAVRDAVLAQQQLIDVVRGYVETRRALCVASVRLAVAGGVPLEAPPQGGAR
jgi:outer membrane protein, heavy metal efflux system